MKYYHFWLIPKFREGFSNKHKHSKIKSFITALQFVGGIAMFCFGIKLNLAKFCDTHPCDFFVGISQFESAYRKLQ